MKPPGVWHFVTGAAGNECTNRTQDAPSDCPGCSAHPLQPPLMPRPLPKVIRQLWKGTRVPWNGASLVGWSLTPLRLRQPPAQSSPARMPMPWPSSPFLLPTAPWPQSLPHVFLGPGTHVSTWHVPVPTCCSTVISQGTLCTPSSVPIGAMNYLVDPPKAGSLPVPTFPRQRRVLGWRLSGSGIHPTVENLAGITGQTDT